jgi:glutamate dehydrogenase (NAD(P)+)
VPAFAAWLAEGRDVADLAGGDAIDPAALLTLPCDVLIPAATGEVIDGANAPQVRARTIIEAANHPLTAEADTMLSARSVEVVPDILANAGGVVVSYFEWTQNIQQFRWPESQVNEQLAAKMMMAYADVRAQAAAHEGSTLREAAFAVAVSRVAQAIRLRGFV